MAAAELAVNCCWTDEVESCEAVVASLFLGSLRTAAAAGGGAAAALGAAAAVEVDAVVEPAPNKMLEIVPGRPGKG